MNAGAIYAFITTIGFKTNNLTVRLLQERGVAAIETYTIYRYALIPSVIWSLIFVRRSDLELIFHSPKLLLTFAVIIVFWNLQAYVRAQTMNSTNSMVLLSTIYNMLVFPLFLGFGAFFNHDKPNAFSVASVLILMAALLIKPTPHQDNSRPHSSKPLSILIALIFLVAFCDTILQGISREALKQLHPTVFLGIFSMLTLSTCWLVSRFYVYQQAKETVAMQQNRLMAVGLIPITWFLASIPESFSLAAIPIYVFISISVVTFLMDTFSDMIHKRIRLSFHTVSFIVIVLLGIALSVLSVN